MALEVTIWICSLIILVCVISCLSFYIFFTKRYLRKIFRQKGVTQFLLIRDIMLQEIEDARIPLEKKEKTKKLFLKDSETLFLLQMGEKEISPHDAEILQLIGRYKISLPGTH